MLMGENNFFFEIKTILASQKVRNIWQLSLWERDCFYSKSRGISLRNMNKQVHSPSYYEMEGGNYK